MADVKKKVDAKYLRKTIQFSKIQFISDELFRKALNDNLQDIVDFINQDKLLIMPEIGWYIDTPEDGTLVFASGWTSISPANGETRNGGFNPNQKHDHKFQGGNIGDGRGLWFMMGGFWRQVTLGTAMPTR